MSGFSVIDTNLISLQTDLLQGSKKFLHITIQVFIPNFRVAHNLAKMEWLDYFVVVLDFYPVTIQPMYLFLNRGLYLLHHLDQKKDPGILWWSSG